jgi:triosephosphate isomerase
LGLSGSDDIATKEFTTKYHLDIPFYSTDGTVIKTAMRTNPGLMLLHAGDVKGKWSYLDYPTYSSLNLDTKDNAIPLFATAPAVVDTTQSH